VYVADEYAYMYKRYYVYIYLCGITFAGRGGTGRGGLAAYVGNPRREENKSESRFFLAHSLNPCT